MIRIVLASTSKIRAQLLRNAGLEFSSIDPRIDEARIKATNAGAKPEVIAEILARAKASSVSHAESDAIVIGADQVLALDGEAFGKPMTMAAARSQLEKLSGRTHTLETAAACSRNGQLLWSTETRATLTMRVLSAELLDWYLAAMGEEALTSVGAYKLEGLGAQLLDHVEGDYFSILGLPLLEVLHCLRSQGALPA